MSVLTASEEARQRAIDEEYARQDREKWERRAGLTRPDASHPYLKRLINFLANAEVLRMEISQLSGEMPEEMNYFNDECFDVSELESRLDTIDLVISDSVVAFTSHLPIWDEVYDGVDSRTHSDPATIAEGEAELAGVSSSPSPEIGP